MTPKAAKSKVPTATPTVDEWAALFGRLERIERTLVVMSEHMSRAMRSQTPAPAPPRYYGLGNPAPAAASPSSEGATDGTSTEAGRRRATARRKRG